MNISGGSFGESFDARSGSVVNLYGTEFFLDGERINSLFLNEKLVIHNRSGEILSGTLIDGSPFSFILNRSYVSGEDFFHSAAVLTVTFGIPEPTTAMLLLLACGGLLCRRHRIGH